MSKVNYETTFGSELKSAVYKCGKKCEKVAKRIRKTPTTLSSRFTEPSKMTLGELKLFILETGMDEKPIIDYLYERK